MLRENEIWHSSTLFVVGRLPFWSKRNVVSLVTWCARIFPSPSFVRLYSSWSIFISSFEIFRCFRIFCNFYHFTLRASNRQQQCECVYVCARDAHLLWQSCVYVCVVFERFTALARPHIETCAIRLLSSTRLRFIQCFLTWFNDSKLHRDNRIRDRILSKSAKWCSSFFTVIKIKCIFLRRRRFSLFVRFFFLLCTFTAPLKCFSLTNDKRLHKTQKWFETFFSLVYFFRFLWYW